MDPGSVDEVGRVPHGSSDDPDVLDFSANVNPELPEGARDAYESAFRESGTYPPDDYPDYRAAAAGYVGCDAERVVPTAGGLAAIRLAAATTLSPGDTALVPFPSFGEYAREVRLQGATPAFVPHDELLAADPDEHALAVACNPNNPTGDAYDPDALRAFARRCRAAGTPLLVDEAFLGFTDHPSLAGEPGVVVARSLTKLFGLPGLRAGFAVAGSGDDGPVPDLGDRLATARPAWSLGWPAARVGAASMRDRAFVERTRERVAGERARMRERLAARFDVHDSDAPFLLLDAGEDPSALLAECRGRGVVLRDATTFRGLDTHVRVAVKGRAANDRLLEVLGV
ncbi:MAG: threonine-phosphate decarboxylase [Haloarculaceae archaeon]